MWISEKHLIRFNVSIHRLLWRNDKNNSFRCRWEKQYCSTSYLQWCLSHTLQSHNIFYTSRLPISLIAHKNQIEQEVENYSPQAKSSMLPVFVIIKFYWNPATPSYSHVACGCFHATMAGVSSCKRNSNTHRTTYLLSDSLQKTFADPLPRTFIFCLFFK